MRSTPIWPLLLAGLVAACGSQPEPRGPWAKITRSAHHTDHAPLIAGPFADGPAVTRACLQCHPQAAREVMATSHWTWQSAPQRLPGRKQMVQVGKKNLINNFCISVISNWAACTTCHAGYGWEDDKFDFGDESRVDCLVCHADPAVYAKKPKGAGWPSPESDLLAAARSVGRPRRGNCGSCHFNGGGGNAVKHGDLDTTLLNPGERVDVHMGRHDLQCVDCHRTEHHRIAGRSISVTPNDDQPVACRDCHQERPHGDARLDAHTARVACQACHIPVVARDLGTKLDWDWSQAGQDLDIKDPHSYLKIKGRFVWRKNVRPTLLWFNGSADRYLLGDKIDPTRVTEINMPGGSRQDERARLFPFKIHTAKQPYDKKHNILLVPNVHGPEGYWTKFDWRRALELGARAAGLPFSGEFGFARTRMYWPINHMVAPASQALQCADCHGPGGRVDWTALGYEYDPARGEPAEPLEHEPVVLRNQAGEPLQGRLEELSLRASCGECHEPGDEDLQAAHAFHAGVKASRLEPERALLWAGGARAPAAEGAESNCLLCHLENPDPAAWRRQLLAGPATGAAAALLAGRSLKPDAEGAVTLPLVRAGDNHCGGCHGLVYAGRQPLVLGDRPWLLAATLRSGQVFSGQRLSQSGINLLGRDRLSRPFDVHAERLLGCLDCHGRGAPPARLAALEGGQPGEQLALRQQGCLSCHRQEHLDTRHARLGDWPRHRQKLTCQACHIPGLPAGRVTLLDCLVPDATGACRPGWEGLPAGRLPEPGEALRYGTPELAKDPQGRLAPVLKQRLRAWYDGKQALDLALVRRAFFSGDKPRAALLEVLDTDHDGRLSGSELVPAPEKLEALAGLLKKAGAAAPRVVERSRVRRLRHGVVGARQALRDCRHCHTDGRQAASKQ